MPHSAVPKVRHRPAAACSPATSPSGQTSSTSDWISAHSAGGGCPAPHVPGGPGGEILAGSPGGARVSAPPPGFDAASAFE
ncbi:hypothetical protein [Mycobacterium parmense]|uniref:hypothetical protein n=1 Tax=Mycobacterium parmense TaxID=185642 RepID=UPI00111C7822|nr:hypothetical protein [Mycobacterium parmense]MCV7349508.1 hypothetical protein [Mycobacterium parmense]